MSERIVVVGGGFAGFWASLAARRAAGPRVEIVLVSQEPMLQIRPRLYEAEPERLQVDLLPLLHRTGVRFLRGEATTLDPDARTVQIEWEREISFSRLVVATGSRLRRPPVPGADETYSIDTIGEAIAFDRRLAEVVDRGRDPTVAVVGGGFTGIELALELRDRIARHGTFAQAERARIVLVDRADVVGPALGEGPRPVIEAALDESNVEVKLGSVVSGLAHDRVVLVDSEEVAADAVVLTTGMAAAGFVRTVPGDRDELGRIRVDRSLRAPAAPTLFVAGDAAAVDGGDGHVVLRSCQHALQTGRFAGENAARDLGGRPMIPYVQPPYITCLDLGGCGAVYTRGWSRTVERTGADAKTEKRRINTEVTYPPSDASGEELLAMSSIDPVLQRRRQPMPLTATA